MADFMVKLKDGRIGKTNQKADAAGKISVFIQNPLEKDGSQPKFEFTKIATKVAKTEFDIIGVL